MPALRLTETSCKLQDLPALQISPSTATATRNNQVELTKELRLASGRQKREFLNALRAKNAAHHLQTLPEFGCTIHAIMRGNYNAWDLVPGVLNLIDPDTITHLGIATLGFNKRNAAQLIALLDAGKIGAVDFICSTMYADKEKAVCYDVATALASRRGRFAAIRCHAKLLLFATGDGRYFVYEGSANLRSCRAIEQFCITQDAELWNFHHEWMDEMLRKHAYGEAQA